MNPTFRVTSYPEGMWWVIRVPGIGVTQAIGPDDVPRTAVDLIATMLGCRPDDVDVAVTYTGGPS
jgi:hypothetical protein